MKNKKKHLVHLLFFTVVVPGNVFFGCVRYVLLFCDCFCCFFLAFFCFLGFFVVGWLFLCVLLFVF